MEPVDKAEGGRISATCKLIPAGTRCEPAGFEGEALETLHALAVV